MKTNRELIVKGVYFATDCIILGGTFNKKTKEMRT